MKDREWSSANRNTNVNDVRKFQREALEELDLLQTPVAITANPSFISSKIFDIVEGRDLGAEARDIVSAYLQNRVSDSYHCIGLGWIKNLEIEPKFINQEWEGRDVPCFGKDFGIALSSCHRRQYIVIMANKNRPVVLLGRDQGKLTAALNMYRYNRRPIDTVPNIQYTPNTLKALFLIPWIHPYIPSKNYRDI